MGKAFQCDRCDELEEGEPEKLVQSADEPKPTVGMEFDQLCSSCAAEHDEFMDGQPIAPEFKGLAFREDPQPMSAEEVQMFTPSVRKITGTFTVGPIRYNDEQPDLPDHIADTNTRNY